MPPAREEGAIARSFRLLKASWRLVAASAGFRSLAALAGLTTVLSFLALFGGFVAARNVLGLPPLAVVIGLAYPLTFVSIFMSVALTAAAAEALQDRPVDPRAALRLARARLPQIALWALLATGVGLLLDSVIRRIPGVGKAAAWALGVAWAVATLFVVPVIALEGCGVRASLRRSARTVRERWGESLTGSLSIYAALLLATFPACALLGVAGAMADHGDTGPALAVGGFAIVLLSAAAVAGLVLRDVFGLALYRYATTGTQAGGFTSRDFEAAMKRRRSRMPLTPGVRRLWIAYGACTAVLVAGLTAGALDLEPTGTQAMLALLLLAAATLLRLAARARAWLVAAGAALIALAAGWDLVDGLFFSPESEVEGLAVLVGFPLALAGLALLSLRRRSPTG